MKKALANMLFTFLSIVGYSQSNNKIVIEPLLKTDTSYGGQKLVYPSGDSTETTLAKVIVPPGCFNRLAYA
jgi:hypothetical protein